MTFTRACLAAPAALTLTLTLTLACDVEEITADTSTLVAFEEPAGAELEVEEPAIADAAAQPDARAVDDLADVDAAAQPDARAVDELADVDGDAPRASFVKLTVNGEPRLTSVPKDGKDYYYFSMSEGKQYTVKMTYYPWNNNYTKDPDLYTHNSSSISLTNYLCRPYLGAGQSETCTFTAPWSGKNYALVHGFTNAAYLISVTSP